MGHASQGGQRQVTAPLKRQNTAACLASRTGDAPAIGPAGLRQTGAGKALAKDQEAGHRCYPKSTSSQTGAWSLGFSQPLASRWTPAAFNEPASASVTQI